MCSNSTPLEREGGNYLELLVDWLRDRAASELGVNVGKDFQKAWEREVEPIPDRKHHTYESGSWENAGYVWESSSVAVTWSRRSVW